MGVELWTIYDRPRDYPEGFIARKWVVEPGCLEPKITAQTRTAAQLSELRNEFSRRGLICLTREPTDQPQIVETWI